MYQSQKILRLIQYKRIGHCSIRQKISFKTMGAASFCSVLIRWLIWVIRDIRDTIAMGVNYKWTYNVCVLIWAGTSCFTLRHPFSKVLNAGVLKLFDQLFQSIFSLSWLILIVHLVRTWPRFYLMRLNLWFPLTF